MIKGKKSVDKSSPMYQTYAPTVIKNLNLKVDDRTGGKWFIHGPKHHRGDELLSLEHACGPFY